MSASPYTAKNGQYVRNDERRVGFEAVTILLFIDRLGMYTEHLRMKERVDLRTRGRVHPTELTARRRMWRTLVDRGNHAEIQFRRRTDEKIGMLL